MEIYHILLDYLQNKEYTESEDIKYLDYLKIMLLKDKRKILEIGKKDKILRGVGEEMIRYNKEIPLGYRDVELEERILMNTYKKEGIREGEERGKEQGKTAEKYNVATNMLKRGYSVEDVCAITNLSLENVKKLQS